MKNLYMTLIGIGLLYLVFATAFDMYVDALLLLPLGLSIELSIYMGKKGNGDTLSALIIIALFGVAYFSCFRIGVVIDYNIQSASRWRVGEYKVQKGTPYVSVHRDNCDTVSIDSVFPSVKIYNRPFYRGWLLNNGVAIDDRKKYTSVESHSTVGECDPFAIAHTTDQKEKSRIESCKSNAEPCIRYYVRIGRDIATATYICDIGDRSQYTLAVDNMCQ